MEVQANDNKRRRERRLHTGMPFKPGLCLLLALAAVAVIGSAAAAEQMVVEYTFERPTIVTSETVGQAYVRVAMPGAPLSGEAGHPLLPATGARILIPYGSEVTSLEVRRVDNILVADDVRVAPAARPVKLSSDPDTWEPPQEDPDIYSLDTPYPAAAHEEIGVQSFRGYQILNLKLQPVQYVPASGELTYSSRLEVIVELAQTGKSSSMLRGMQVDEVELEGRVDNPEAIGSYPAVSMKSRDAFDMVIITTDALTSYFQPLKDYHDTTGVLTEIHTTTDIGSTDPDDVRDYIADLYTNDGIEYVLIGADDDIIPAKDLWVEAWSGGDVETEMPGDVYFGCLDGTWDFDNDGNAGEPNDGIGGGDVDLTAEVFVGRASVGNATEATRFVDKTIWYMTGQHDRPQNVLMVGEYLGFGGASDYAAGMMDQNVDGSSADGYTTVGIPSDMYMVDRLYDETWSGNDWPQSEIISRINAGQHIINHLGHGSPDYAMKLYNSNVTSDLNNTGLCFLYSQTCLAGHLDGTDCFAETMNIKTDYGAFAVCMNARYGWGSYNSTDGPSQRFNREFWDAVFSTSEGMPELGRASQDSKEDNLYRVDESCMRWIYYEQNLFGDPTVSISGVSSIAFDFSEPFPETVEPYEEVTIEVTVIPVGDGVPVSGSGLLHYSIDGGIWTAASMTEVTTNVYEATLPQIGCDEDLAYYFSAEEETNGAFYAGNASNPYTLFAATEVFVPFTDDFESDMGWTVSGDAGDGQWDRGTPVGGGDRGDPSGDFDGSGQCYLTDNVDGNSDVDDGTTTLTSPIIDLSSGDADIHYARWYSNNYGDDPNNDIMYVYITNDDGGNWVLVEEIGPTEQANGGWYEHTFAVSTFVTPTDQVRVRFDVSDLSSGSVVEAAIDDFTVTRYECIGYICGDVDADGEGPNVADLIYLVSYMFDYGPEPSIMDACDFDGNGEMPNIEDLVYLVTFMFQEGPALQCF